MQSERLISASGTVLSPERFETDAFVFRFGGTLPRRLKMGLNPASLSSKS